ncbi:hypothetical protein D9615_002169 [Tricholomella constricta]|uniref:Uncharacterized protein n=1 Tax=Tricholomella constricta TaxID=117010 RepID=A0A8H5M9X8_9AGAR|nr:hypothetical protein D9615_002169 [Tricholomella constricta]
MADQPSRGQGLVQPGLPTSLTPSSSRQRVSSNQVSGSAPPSRGTWPDPVLPQSFATFSAPVSPYYNVPNSWSQTQFLASSVSQQDLTQIPSYSSPPTVRPLSTTAAAVLLKPPSIATGYVASQPSAFLLQTSDVHPPLSAPASSTGLSYAYSHHRPPTQNSILPPVPNNSHHTPISSIHPSPLPSPPFPSPQPRIGTPIAPIPIRPVPYNNFDRAPSFHTPIPPAPPYFQIPPRPSPHIRLSPSLASPLSSMRPASISSLFLQNRPMSAPHHLLSPISPVLRQLPHSTPASPVLPTPVLPILNNNASVSTYTKPDFPNLSSIPLLSSANDWSKWHSAVLQVIEATGLYSHIVDILPADVLLDPTAYPSLPPIIDKARYTPEELDAYRSWWAQDDIVSFVLVGKLGPIPSSLIPPKHDAWGNPQRSARDILRILRTKYGVYNAASAALVRESVLSKKVRFFR